MKAILIPEKLKYYYEPYALGLLSFEHENYVIIYKDEVKWEKIYTKIIKIQDLVNSFDKERFSQNFNYSILPDHGFKDVFNSNIYSNTRVGRLYIAAGINYKKHDLYKKNFFIKRDSEQVIDDMNILKLKYNVNNFEIINNCIEAKEFSEKHRINLINI